MACPKPTWFDPRNKHRVVEGCLLFVDRSKQLKLWFKRGQSMIHHTCNLVSEILFQQTCKSQRLNCNIQQLVSTCCGQAKHIWAYRQWWIHIGHSQLVEDKHTQHEGFILSRNINQQFSLSPMVHNYMVSTHIQPWNHSSGRKLCISICSYLFSLAISSFH